MDGERSRLEAPPSAPEIVAPSHPAHPKLVEARAQEGIIAEEDLKTLENELNGLDDAIVESPRLPVPTFVTEAQALGGAGRARARGRS